MWWFLGPGIAIVLAVALWAVYVMFFSPIDLGPIVLNPPDYVLSAYQDSLKREAEWNRVHGYL